MDEDDSGQGPILEDESLLEHFVNVVSAKIDHGIYSAASKLEGVADKIDSKSAWQDDEDSPENEEGSEGGEGGESSEGGGNGGQGEGGEGGQGGEGSDGDGEGGEDAEAKKEAKEKERKGQVAKIKKKLKDDSKKKLAAKIGMTFLNPATTIPVDIQQALKDTGKSIKDTSQKAMQNQILKPQEKAEAVKEIALENAKVGAKETIIQTILKAIREVVKKLYQTAPVAPYVWAATAIIVALLFTLLIILAIMVACSGGGAATEPEAMGENYTITSKYFYGIRTAYADEAILVDALQLSYKQYVVDIIEYIDNAYPSIKISIELPEITEEEPFTNATPVDEHITNMSLAIANVAAGNSATYEGVDMTALYPEIPYFGLEEGQFNDVNDFIEEYLEERQLITGSEADKIAEAIDMAASELTYMTQQCEKLMIQDFISDKDGLKGLQQHIYVGSVYMPHTDITINTLTAVISTPTHEIPVDSEIKLKDGDSVSSLASGTTDTSEGKIDLTVSCDIISFKSILENKQAFANGVSLLGALRLISLTSNSELYSQYFTTLEDNDKIYTWVPGCDSLYATYNSESPFIFGVLDLAIEGDDSADEAIPDFETE